MTTQSAQIATNRDVFQWGRWVWPTDGAVWHHHNWDLVTFMSSFGVPSQKKQDMMFVLRGRADTTTPLRPIPTTNMACPGWCVLVGSHENAPGGDPSRAFNVLIRELMGNGDGSYQAGSFYLDDINFLRSSIVSNMLEGPPGTEAVSTVYPLSDWYPDRMNFYVARENPDTDPDYLRGFMHCANIDAIIDVNPGPGDAAVSVPGTFEGIVRDPRLYDMREQTLHEVFGHGAAALQDEYVCSTDYSPCDYSSANEPYTPDSAPLGSGSTACSDPSSAAWCTSSLNVDELIAEMQAAGDPDVDCWGFDATQCAASADTCHTIAGGVTIPYFGPYVCVPKNVVKYDIGVGCLPNSGCYIGTAVGEYAVNLTVAQPSVPVMGSQHYLPGNPPSYLGFGGAVEPQYDMLLNCIFDSTGCATYDYTACSAFENKWDGGAPNVNNIAFLQGANACIGGLSHRR